MLQTKNPKFYWFFDRIISSHIDLPELIEAKQSIHTPALTIFIHEGEVVEYSTLTWTNHWYTPNNQLILSSTKRNDKYFLNFSNLGIFQIDCQAMVVVCMMHDGIPLETTRHLLLDQTLPRIWAHFFHSPIVHASCIELDGIGMCFLGDTGTGKSTMAAALSRTGGKIVGDDCLLLDATRARLSCWPSYPSLRLLPDSFDNIQLSPSLNSNPVAHYSNKTRIAFTTQARQKTDLNVIIFLQSEKHSDNIHGVTFSQPSKSKCLQGLLRQSFALDLHDHSFLKTQFSAFSKIVHSDIPFYSLQFRRSYRELPQVIDSIGEFLISKKLTASAP